MVRLQRCGTAEGIVAHGAINLGAAPAFADGFCLHSQTAIALPLGTRTEEPFRLSLPDPSRCEGICAPDPARLPRHPDVRPTALNLVMSQTRVHVERLAAAFLDPKVTLPEEPAFFATRPWTATPRRCAKWGFPPTISGRAMCCG